MNIYLPMEIKLREFEGRGLLALAAAERGHTVIFGGKEDTVNPAKKGAFPPGIVHMKSLAPSEKNLTNIKCLVKHGNLVTSQDEEHGLLDQSYDWFTQIRFSAETLDKVSTLFTWGSHDTAALHARYPIYAKKIMATGSPRVDFWRPDFAPYYYQNVPGQPNLESYKPYILIVSSFVKVLNENRIWNVIATQRKGGFFERNAEDEFRLYEISSYQTRLVKEFVKLIRRLSVTYPDLKIVIRPHPVESISAWVKMIGDYPNLVVTREGTISNWIRHAVVLIHNSSTSALEAAACKVPCIAFRPLPSEYERAIANSLSWEASSPEEVEEIVSALGREIRVEGYEKSEAASLKLLEERFSNLSGSLAADKIVDQWEKIASSNNLESMPPRKFLYRSMGSRSRQQAADLLKGKFSIFNSLAPGEDKEFKTAHKYPDLQEQEIKTLVARLQSATGRFKKVRYKKFGRRSFILFSK